MVLQRNRKLDFYENHRQNIKYRCDRIRLEISSEKIV